MTGHGYIAVVVIIFIIIVVVTVTPLAVCIQIVRCLGDCNDMDDDGNFSLILLLMIPFVAAPWRPPHSHRLLSPLMSSPNPSHQKPERQTCSPPFWYQEPASCVKL